jgi:predicted adenine nucleotide alpha hydrolase (AANH) superfamily ATPase/FMN phosphatase YigB (HAD superfamily)
MNSFSFFLKKRDETGRETKFTEFLKEEGFSKEEDVLQKADLTFSNHIFDVEPIPEIFEVLQEAKLEQIPVYLVSNSLFTKKTIEETLKANSLDTYFTDLFVSSEIGFRKPSLDFFHFVEKRVKSKGVFQKEIWYLGDRDDCDKEPAKKLGYTFFDAKLPFSYHELAQALKDGFQKNYSSFQKFLERIKQKPTLLIHSCCGPCSSYVLEKLNPYFDVTIYYYNPNILPETEFQKRVEYQKKVIEEVDSSIKLVVGDYNPTHYFDAIKGYENYPEGSERCFHCYEFRLRACARYAKENQFDFFTTTLSISPYKNSEVINQQLQSLEKEFQVHALYSDFKKEEGYKKSILFCKTHDIYRQDYCGCPYSQKEHEEKVSKQDKSREHIQLLENKTKK